MPPDVREAAATLHERRPELRIDVRWCGTVPSTMDVVASAAEQGSPAGLVVIADCQTAGRGRRGHAWSSPAGAGLYLSYLARPTRDVGLITLAAGVAVHDAIAATTGLDTDLKWPNDVMVGSRKLAGLLAEGARLGTAEAVVIIGIGLNLLRTAYPPDVEARATSIDVETNRVVDRGAVLAAIVEHLADTLAALERGEAGDILTRWRAASRSSRGTAVTWDDGGRQRRGLTAGIDDSGALLVRTADGLERLIAGELAWQI